MWHVSRNQRMLDEEHKEGRRWKKTHSRICAKAGITRQCLSNWIRKSSSRAYAIDSRERKKKIKQIGVGKQLITSFSKIKWKGIKTQSRI